MDNTNFNTLLRVPTPSETTHNKLIDKFGRQINYVRLSVTDRCNLRCIYCMPEKGMRFLPKYQLLSFEELENLVQILAEMGITKVRITGGEPFVRKNLMMFLWKLRNILGIEQIHITTNGVLTGPYIPELKSMGIAGINLSLDTLDKNRFYQITRRDNFEEVMNCFDQILSSHIPLKINMVLVPGQNTRDIIPMAQMTKDHPVNVRFIEEMPFNGAANYQTRSLWNYHKILQTLKRSYPDIYKIEDPQNSTSLNYQIPGFSGSIGIIAGFSRIFCGACNRIRINAKGMLKTCLYGESQLDLKALLRNNVSQDNIKAAFQKCVGRKLKDGWETQQQRKSQTEISESMSIIGG